MQRLQRIDPNRHAAREALPDVLNLERYGISFQRGQVSMIAGWPSVGKSVLALGGLAVPWARRGIKILYFSADSDEYTTLKRAAAAITGKPQAFLKEQMATGWAEVQEAMAALPGSISFSFETDPTYEHLYAETIAFYCMWGEYPDAIFVDNLMDVAGENENEYGGMRDTNKAAKRLARLTGSHVNLLHHCNEDKGDNILFPPPRTAITGKVTQKAELVFTLGLDEAAGIQRLAPVKVRDGKQDRSAKWNIPFRLDFEHMRYSDMNYIPLGQ